MSLFDYFRSSRKSSASVAKERLKIIVAHERGRRGGPDYLPQMEEELLAVVRKYTRVGDDAVRVNLEKDQGFDVMEVNITLPERDED